MLEALDACPPVLSTSSIEDMTLDILAGSQDVIQAAEADVVCPAVAAEDPDGLWRCTACSVISADFAASSSSLSSSAIRALQARRWPGAVLGSDELLASSLQLCGCLVGTSNPSDLLDQVLADGLLGRCTGSAMLCVILEQGVAPCSDPRPLSLLTVYGEMDAVPPQMERSRQRWRCTSSPPNS